MSNSRQKRIQRMFEEMGLGEEQTRQRFSRFERMINSFDVQHQKREQVFIRTAANTDQFEEPENG